MVFCSKITQVEIIMLSEMGLPQNTNTVYFPLFVLISEYKNIAYFKKLET